MRAPANIKGTESLEGKIYKSAWIKGCYGNITKFVSNATIHTESF